MENEKKYYGEKEITIKEIIFFVLRKWRIILVGTLVCFLLAIGFYAVKGTPKDASQARDEISTESEAKQIKEMKLLETSIDEQEQEMENSNLFQASVNKTEAISFQYYVKLQGENEDVRIAYQTYVAEGLKKEIANTLDAEVLAYAKGEKNSFIIKIICIDKEETDIVQAVEALLNTYKTTVSSSICEHELVLVNTLYQKGSSEELLQWKTNMKNELQSLQQRYNEIKTLAASESNSMKRDVKTGMYAKVAARNIIFFTILGFLCLNVLCVIAYFFDSRLSSYKEIRQCYGLNYLGEVQVSVKKKLFKWVDKGIWSLEYPEQRSLSAAQRLELVCKNIELKCRMIGSSNVCICDCRVIKHDAAVEKLAVLLKEQGVEPFFGGDIRYQSKTLEKAVNAKKIILMEGIGYDSREKIMEEIQLCREYEIEIMGVITFRNV